MTHIVDPDYGRVYSKARCIAWSYGWNLVAQGTGSRDLDLLMVPWTPEAAPAVGVVRRIADVCDLAIPHEPREKPHGRIAWTLMFKEFGDPRWVDLSVMPRIDPPAAQAQP